MSVYNTTICPTCIKFQSTSSEEDVVSMGVNIPYFIDGVSIHVLRRGRCVTYFLSRWITLALFQSTSSEEDVVSPLLQIGYKVHIWFQSTSSEEDVVSGCKIIHVWQLYGFNPRPPKRTLCLDKDTFDPLISMFQSTSSEEDVVSDGQIVRRWVGRYVSIHVLRRGRCVY